MHNVLFKPQISNNMQSIQVKKKYQNFALKNGLSNQIKCFQFSEK